MHIKAKNHLMKYLITLVLFLFSYLAFGTEDCSPTAIGLDDSSHISESLYYTGTCHYRNEEYEFSAKYWGELSNLENVEEEYEGLQINSLNNLGYLKFFGYGIDEDKEGAISLWKKAILLGHYESEYHLCHAYADIDQPTFNYTLGKKHCEKAYLIYNGMEEPSEEIMGQINKYRSELNKY